MAQGDTRCIDGTLFKHLPQWDDPEFEQAAGRCPECNGIGCYPCHECGRVTLLKWFTTGQGAKMYLCAGCVEVMKREDAQDSREFGVDA